MEIKEIIKGELYHFIFHKEDGPARIWRNKDQAWYQHDVYKTEVTYEDH